VQSAVACDVHNDVNGAMLSTAGRGQAVF